MGWETHPAIYADNRHAAMEERTLATSTNHAQVTVTMLLLVNIMSWAPALAGVGVTVILVPAGSFISRRLAAIRRDIVRCTDARMKLTTEVLLGIKTIKCAASRMRECPP